MGLCITLLVFSLHTTAHAVAPLAPPEPHAVPFADPPSIERSRFRYWLPDRGVDPYIVKADIQSVGSIRGGDLEFLNFFEYGDHFGSMPPGADWLKNNFGTPFFQTVFKN